MNASVCLKSGRFGRPNLQRDKWQFKPKSKIARSLAFGGKTWKKKNRDVITTSSGQAYRDLQIKSEFDTLVKNWRKATAHLSFTGQIIIHPAYLRIIGMGNKALPLIFEELQKRPSGNWFSALEAITGNDIAQDARNIEEAIQFWLQWWKQNQS